MQPLVSAAAAAAFPATESRLIRHNAALQVNTETMATEEADERGAVSAQPTCFHIRVHANRPRLRRLAALQAVVDVGGLPAGVLPVLDVLQTGTEALQLY